MRYGVIFSCQDPEGSPIGHPAVYESALACAVAAEEQGYDWINVTEHHVAADGYLPALFVLLAAMAARTERIRLSTGMLILTLHSPLRIAEEAAVLDIISGGRLTLGVAAGYREVEFEAMQVDYRTRGKRFVESLELMRLAWTGEPFTFSGEIFDFPELVVRPVPDPASRASRCGWAGRPTVALRRVVRHGAPVFPGATDEIAVVAQRMAVLRPPARGARAPIRARRASSCCRAWPWWPTPPRRPPPRSAWHPGDARDLPVVGAARRLHEDAAATGRCSTTWSSPATPITAGRAVERYAELGLTDLLLQFAMPTLEPAVIAESQARFMAEVATPAAEVQL